MTAMRYVGKGRHLVGIPARDLEGDEVARLPDRLRRRLTASGLYVPVRPSQPVKAKEVMPDV